MNWQAYFDMMIDWKKLPAYKAEPRIDSLVGFYLKDILSEFLNTEITSIIPELPIRLATVRPELEGTIYAERSYKVDFLAVGSNGINYLVEFKTDTGSRRDKQDKYLIQAKEKGTESIINGILQIARVSSYVKKYDHLKDKLSNVGLLNSEMKYSGLNPDFEIIYVQPNKNNAMEQVIEFDYFASWLDKQSDLSSFEIELSRALRVWADD